MARNHGSVCRLCRREGLKLYLKGDRCYSDKCAIDRRRYAPGQHGQGHQKLTDYGLQLREKQKAKRIYNILERQFRIYVGKAERTKGITGENLLRTLERRLDNIVYRMGFANSRAEARHLVKHNHFLVNQKRVNIPSYLVHEGEEIQVREKSKKLKRINEALETVTRRGLPSWLEVDREKHSGVIKSMPTREELPAMINDQLIVELYSK